jgi:hypothetical protein
MCHSVVFFFCTKTGLASQSEQRISLMNPVAINFAISFLIAAFLSGENHHSRSFIGLEPLLTSILCSANSLGTPSMLASFQAKICLLSRRKLVSMSSYLGERWALMVAVLEGSPIPRSICFTSASFRGARMLGFFVGTLVLLS